MIIQPLSRDEMNGMLTSFATVARMFIEQEDDKLFGLGLAMKASIESGLPKDSVLEVAGTETGRSKKKINQLYAVATVFGERRWEDFDWMTHVIAATAPGVEADNLDTHHVAYEWMRVAVDGYDSKQGRKAIRRKHTARTLRKLIRAANAPSKAGKPETVYKGEATVISANEWTDKLVITIPHVPNQSLEMWSILQWCKCFGENIQITITRAALPAAETAQAESEAVVA